VEGDRAERRSTLAVSAYPTNPSTAGRLFANPGCSVRQDQSLPAFPVVKEISATRSQLLDPVGHQMQAVRQFQTFFATSQNNHQ